MERNKAGDFDVPSTALKYLQKAAMDEGYNLKMVDTSAAYPNFNHSTQKSGDCGVEATFGALAVMLQETMGEPATAHSWYKKIKAGTLTGLYNHAKSQGLSKTEVNYDLLGARIDRAMRQHTYAADTRYSDRVRMQIDPSIRNGIEAIHFGAKKMLSELKGGMRKRKCRIPDDHKVA